MLQYGLIKSRVKHIRCEALDVKLYLPSAEAGLSFNVLSAK